MGKQEPDESKDLDQTSYFPHKQLAEGSGQINNTLITGGFFAKQPTLSLPPNFIDSKEEGLSTSIDAMSEETNHFFKISDTSSSPAEIIHARDNATVTVIKVAKGGNLHLNSGDSSQKKAATIRFSNLVELGLYKPNFLPRPALLKKIGDHFSKTIFSEYAVLVGMGGVGRRWEKQLSS